jgi:hypothetical protein
MRLRSCSASTRTASCGLAHDLAGLGLRIGDDAGCFLLSVRARLGGHAGVFHALCDLLLAGVQHVEHRLVHPGLERQQHDRERQDLEDQKPKIETKLFQSYLPA